MTQPLGRASIEVVVDDSQVRRLGKDSGSFFGTAFAVAAGDLIADMIRGVGRMVKDLAIGPGLSRALDIEDATARMAALGFATGDVDQAMEAALDSVLGTAFGLDEAAKSASLFMAAGVPVEDLEGILSSVAGAAALTGESFDRISDIFTTAAAGGRVTGRELQRLQQAGVPALSILAEHLGVTGEEVRKMVSAGEIDFATFAEAMQAGTGDAAVLAAQTTRGAVSLMGSAFARLGATFIEPLLPVAREVFLGIRDTVDRVTAGLRDRLAELTEAGFFERLSESVGTFFGALEEGEGIFAALRSAIDDTFLEGDSLISGFGDTLIDGLKSLAEKMLARAPELFAWLIDVAARGFTALLDWLASSGIPSIVNWLIASRERLLEAGIRLFQSLLAAVIAVIPDLVQSLANALGMVIEFLVEAIPMLLHAGVELFLALVEALVEILPDLIATLAEVIVDVLDALVEMLPDLIEAGITLFLGLVDALVEVLPELINTLLTVVLPKLIEALLVSLPLLLEAAITLFFALVEAVLEILPQLVDTIIHEVMPTVARTLIAMAPQLLDAAIALFMQLVRSVARVVPQLLAAIWELGRSIIRAILNFGPEMARAGAQMIGSLAKGILDRGRRLVGEVRDSIVGGIRRLWPFSPAKEGPFKRFPPELAGENIMELFAKGIAKGGKEAVDAAALAMDSLLPNRVQMEADIRQVAPRGGDGATGGTGVSIGELHVHGNPDPEVIFRARDLARSVVGG